jgi:hypothetical protein
MSDNPFRDRLRWMKAKEKMDAAFYARREGKRVNEPAGTSN